MSVYDSPAYREDLIEALAHSVGLAVLDGATVLITGAGGLIGSFLVDELLLAKEALGVRVSVVATGRNLGRLSARFAGCPWGTTRVAELDMASGGGIPDLHADYIVHAASNSHPASIAAGPLDTVEANVGGTLRLLRWGRSHGLRRLLYVSSAEVYGRVGNDAPPALPEGWQGYLDPMTLRSCYPLAKRMAESICACWADAGDAPEVVVARPAHTYGPTSSQSDSRATAQFARRAAAGEDVELRSAGARVRSHTYVADAASGLLTVLCSGEPGQAYNVAVSGVGTSIREVAEAYATTAGLRVAQEDGDMPDRNETTIERLVLDSDKLCSLGWSDAFPLSRGVEHDIRIRQEALSDKQCWKE